MTDAEGAWMEGAYDFIQDRARQPCAIESSMRELIAFCHRSEPHSDWARLSAINFAMGVGQLNAWLEETFREEPPGDEICGLWFGLFNPANGEGSDSMRDATADLYVGGSPHYACSDLQHDWAADLTYLPGRRYARSAALAAIYTLAYRGPRSLGNSAEYPLCLGFAAFWMREVLDHPQRRALIAGARGRGVAVGFDSGDAIDFGKVITMPVL